MGVPLKSSILIGSWISKPTIWGIPRHTKVNVVFTHGPRRMIGSWWLVSTKKMLKYCGKRSTTKRMFEPPKKIMGVNTTYQLVQNSVQVEHCWTWRVNFWGAGETSIWRCSSGDFSRYLNINKWGFGRDLDGFRGICHMVKKRTKSRDLTMKNGGIMGFSWDIYSYYWPSGNPNLVWKTYHRKG